ncbi:MAG: hypothetical protein KA751_07415 [Comamonas sp.]|nr:hypothetical protein [Comamonas sp.]
MSIVFRGFLGQDTQNIENRFVLEFARIGFEVAIHPDMKLLGSNFGHLCLVLIKIPPNIKCLDPDTPLLTEFEYSASMRTSPMAQEGGWPPRRVRQYTYEIFSRTASGRTTSSYFAQAFTVAILAKITNGQFLADGSSEAVSGQSGLESVLAELERYSGLVFDVGADPFHEWPPLNPAVSSTWQEPLKAPDSNHELIQRLPRKKFKITVMGVFYTAIFLYFLTVTLLYS